MDNEYNSARAGAFNITHFIVRLVVGAIVLAVTAALTPGFSISGFWPLLLGALVLAVLDYMAFRFLGIKASPFSRGVTGFVMAAVIIYLTKYLVPGFNVTIWGALLGALIYGIVDAIIPGKTM